MQLAEDRARTLGITRNRNSELARLKGRMKAPPKRYSSWHPDSPKRHSGKQVRIAQPSGRWLNHQGFAAPCWSAQRNRNDVVWPRVDASVSRALFPSQRSGNPTSLIYDSEGELRKEKLRKMASVREDKHDQLMQRFAGEAATVWLPYSETGSVLTKAEAARRIRQIQSWDTRTN